MNYDEALAKLAQYGQTHVLAHFSALDEEQQNRLLAQVESTDFSQLHYVHDQQELGKRGKIEPLGAMELPEIEAQREKFEALGLEAIRGRRVGAVLLAGGMGTRLGSDNPKCMYDIGVTKHVYILERLIDNLMEVVERAGGVYVPLFVMTSEKNHDVTVRFMQEKNYFGYDPKSVYVFTQEMAPATDYSGKVYMEAPDRIATSPNGNGGWFTSMDRAGLLDVIHSIGIEWLNVFAVDNVLQRIADPVFVGACIDRDTAVGAKVVRKVSKDEKVGAMCLEDGRPSIVEYYDMTDELKDAKNEKGDPAYNFGVILNYLFREKELERIMDEKIPLHLVEKKIPYIDEAGNPVHPEAPNGYKFEQLVLDMIHELPSCLPFEVVREREFAPIKNATGVDSVESARKLCALNGIEL